MVKNTGQLHRNYPVLILNHYFKHGMDYLSSAAAQFTGAPGIFLYLSVGNYFLADFTRLKKRRAVPTSTS